MEYLRGQLLIAGPTLHDPNFARSVTGTPADFSSVKNWTNIAGQFAGSPQWSSGGFVFPDQPTIDCREPDADQRHAGEMLRR